MTKGKVLFRFAPQATRDLHIGDLRIALFNYICALQAKDTFLIRIDDTDAEANIEGKDQEILKILSLFHIPVTNVTYQSHNRKFHQQLATKLLMDQHAFSCFCTPESLKKHDCTCEHLSDEAVLNNESPFCVRIKRPQHDITCTDRFKGTMHFKKETIDNFVILRVDKSPSTLFAAALDDMLGDISMIIREEEQLNHTPKEIMIRDYLGYDKEITYAHLPSICDAHTTSLKSLLEEGFLPSAITNYLIMTGNETPTEIFDLQEAISWFDLDKISTVTFDINKLRHINREHIKKTADLELAKFLGYSSQDIGAVAKVYTEEASTINEIKPKLDAIFAKKEPLEFQEEFATLRTVAQKAPFFKEFDDLKAHLAAKSGLKGKEFSTPLRFLLTGSDKGPNLGDIYPHIKNYLGEIIK